MSANPADTPPSPTDATSAGSVSLEELQRLRTELAAKERQIVDLRVRQGELEQRLKSVDRLAQLGSLGAGIAHEIKNPLNFIVNFASLSTEMVRDLEEVLDDATEHLPREYREEIEDIIEDLRSNVEKVAEHGKRADSIVRSMLMMARGNMGHRVPVDLNEVARTSLTLAYHGVRALDVSFNAQMVVETDPAIGLVEVHSAELNRALLNLFSNACEAVDERRRHATIGYKPTVRLTTRSLGDEVEIRIHDNGVGMPEEIHDRIFEAFFSTKVSGSGTGLGLSITHEIITRQHQGRLEFTSKKGEFTEFVITLPRHAAKDPSATVPGLDGAALDDEPLDEDEPEE